MTTGGRTERRQSGEEEGDGEEGTGEELHWEVMGGERLGRTRRCNEVVRGDRVLRSGRLRWRLVKSGLNGLDGRLGGSVGLKRGGEKKYNRLQIPAP